MPGWMDESPFRPADGRGNCPSAGVGIIKIIRFMLRLAKGQNISAPGRMCGICHQLGRGPTAMNACVRT